ncbi:MAG TPA: CBS domain-containing protein [Gaiellaceae bacterium]|nr:CBS domain-containing protein [Gaiellaceae bacterium]
MTCRRCRYRVEPLHVEISDVGAGAGLTSPFPTAFFGASRWKAARRKCDGTERARGHDRESAQHHPSEPVVKAARIMRDEDIGSLPVVEQDRLYGMITDRDITTRVVAQESDLGSISVRDVASTGPVCVDADSDLDEALHLMAHHQVRWLPVVDGGRLVGILAQADVAHEEQHEKVGETVEAISDPSTENRH